MKVYRSLAEFNTLECAVATTGTFDGVHLGHQKILNQLVQTAHKVGGESVLLTFDPHPRVVLQPDVAIVIGISSSNGLLAYLVPKVTLVLQVSLYPSNGYLDIEAPRKSRSSK